jgi:hypothetical protein
MWPLLDGGKARASVGERRSFVLTLSEGGGVSPCLAGPRGAEEFHDGGVTAARGNHERRPPILKERTERERARRRGGAANKNTHDEGEREEGKRETEAR